ncbi:MAG: TetR/AcrR family transcriptional regulator [Deltaproteobacteria bacterium]|nr:TetR/AcrR family transcriptional regulator [Deltaproteobacteria bacterium]
MRERILACALSRFSRDGFEATSLRAIADDLDVSVPTLRNYFGSKDGLLVATLHRVFGVVDLGVRQIVKRGLPDPDQALQLAIAINNANRALSPDLMAHIMRVAATEPEVGIATKSLTDSLESIVAYAQKEWGGRKDVEASQLAQVIADLMLGAMVDWAQSLDIDPRAHTEIILRAAFDLVIPPDPPRTLSPTEEAFQALPLAELAPPTRSERSKRPHAILEVARRRFAENGVRETSLESIAKELSIAPLTILYHFGSKDGLIAQLTVELADVIESAVQDVLAGGEETDIAEGVEAITARISELPPYGSKLTAEILRVMVTHPEASAASRRIHGAIARMIELGQERGFVGPEPGPSLLAQIVLDLYFGGVLRRVQSSPSPIADSLIDVLRSSELILHTSAPTVP